MKKILNSFVFEMIASISLLFASCFFLSAGYFTKLLLSGIELTEGRFCIVAGFWGMGFLFLVMWVMFGYSNYKYNI